MALSPTPLSLGTPDTVALTDFNNAINLLNAAFPLIAANIGVDAVITVKIKDLNVTVDKLAVDAVETVKIKDLAVTVGKLAGGITATKLATDAVETIKIKAKNVTESKLADDALSQRLVEYLVRKTTGLFFDEFLGAVLGDAWAQSGDAGGSITLIRGRVKIKTGVVSGNAYRINWNGIESYLLDTEKPKLVTHIQERSGNTYVTHEFGFIVDATHYVIFRADDNVGAIPNWEAVCRNGGAETVVDTGVALGLGNQRFKIDYIATNSVKFCINEVEKAEITTNIPTTMFAEVQSEIKTNTSAYGSVDHSFFLVQNTRIGA